MLMSWIIWHLCILNTQTFKLLQSTLEKGHYIKQDSMRGIKMKNLPIISQCKNANHVINHFDSVSLSEAVVKWLWSSSTFKKIEMIHFPLFARLQFLCTSSSTRKKQENDPIYRQGFLFLKPPPSTIDHSMAKLEKMYKKCIPEYVI